MATNIYCLGSNNNITSSTFINHGEKSKNNIKLDSINNINISGCEFNGITTGINLYGSTEVTIEKNKINTTNDYAIKSQNSNVVVNENELKSNGKSGDDTIEIRGGNVDSQGNTNVFADSNLEANTESKLDEETLVMAIIINATLDESPSKNVTITIFNSDGEVAYVENVVIAGGKANLKKTGVADGVYNYTIEYIGDDNFKPASINGTVTVSDSRSVPVLDVVTGSELDSDSLVVVVSVNVSIAASGKVSVVLLDASGSVVASEVVDIVDGVAKFSKSGLADGVYNYTVSYDENVDFKAASANGTVTVNDTRSEPNVDDIAVSMDGNSGVIKLPENAQGKITLTINGKDYDFDVVNGVAKVDLPDLSEGDYSYNLTYSGDSNYASFNKTGSLTIKKNSPVSNQTKTPTATKITLTLKKVKVKKSAKKLVIKATLKINGKLVKGKIIKFKFNQKNYKAKTNRKGIAKITVKKAVLKKLKVGKKVKYQAKYGKVTKKSLLKLKGNCFGRYFTFFYFFKRFYILIQSLEILIFFNATSCIMND